MRREAVKFWNSVREIVAMRDQIPEERHAGSLVRAAIAEDVLPRKGTENSGAGF